jgi:hypothetical protein
MQYDSVEVESSNEEDDITALLQDLAKGIDAMGELEVNEGQQEEGQQEVGQQKEDVETFFKLVDDAGKELYPGCRNFSKLRFMVRLLHIKFLGGWSNKSFDMLLELLKDVLPDGSSLPKNFNAAKNTVKYLGLGYTNIHACVNHCILFWKEQYKDLNVCPRCNTSRWKSENTSPNGKRVHRVPNKVLRYFPIKKGCKDILCPPKQQMMQGGTMKDGQRMVCLGIQQMLLFGKILIPDILSLLKIVVI